MINRKQLEWNITFENKKECFPAVYWVNFWPVVSGIKLRVPPQIDQINYSWKKVPNTFILTRYTKNNNNNTILKIKYFRYLKWTHHPQKGKCIAFYIKSWQPISKCNFTSNGKEWVVCTIFILFYFILLPNIEEKAIVFFYKW